jgi:hypothetical protein
MNLNQITNHGGSGVDMTVFDSGTLLAHFRGNDITLNGAPDFIAEIDAAALPAALLGLALTDNNIFSSAPDLQNNSVLPFATFLLENDGSNSPAVPVLTGPITPVGPGTIDALALPLRVFP